MIRKESIIENKRKRLTSSIVTRFFGRRGCSRRLFFAVMGIKRFDHKK